MKTDLSTTGRQAVYQRKIGCLPEGESLSTRRKQAVYHREKVYLSERDR